MDMVPPVPLPLTRGADFDFSGGDLTSDGGALLLAQLSEALGVRPALRSALPSHPLRTFDDADVAYQRALLCALGHPADDDATALRRDPALAHALGGPLASQETMSRRLSGMGPADVGRLRGALGDIASSVAALEERDAVVVDVDTTLLRTCGAQEGACWNFHYGDDGYHPIVAVDPLARDVLGFELRPGSQYCSRGAGAFAERVIGAVADRHPRAAVALRADSGFAAPEVYAACEAMGAHYAVRLKSNAELIRLAEPVSSLLEPGEERALCGEFAYRAGSWDRERRVVFEARMEAGELLPRLSFVVTDLPGRPREVLGFYRGRGAAELVIGDLKGFLAGASPRRPMAANEYCCLLGCLAYSLVNWLRRLCLDGAAAGERAATVLARTLKVAARRVSHAGRSLFRLASSYPRQGLFYRAMQRCWGIARAPG